MKEYDVDCIHGISVYDYCNECHQARDVLEQFEDDGALDVLRTYLKLHEGKIGAHWLWCAIERLNLGESEAAILADYGYYRSTK